MFFLSCSDWTLPNMLIRIIVSCVLGSIIGLDRGSKKRGAGIKTNTIVCLGSTLVMLTAQYMTATFPGEADMSRMAAQVISGVGFLGVGTIIVSGHQVRGLTTAATLWTCACVGLAVGIGFIDGAVLITAIMIGSLHFLPYVERLFYRHNRYTNLYIELETNKAISTFMETMQQENITIDSMDLIKSKAKGQPAAMQVTLRLPTPFQQSYIDTIESIPGIVCADLIS